MQQFRSRAALTAALVASLIIGFAGVAAAVSGGGYSPGQQDCPAGADANTAGARQPNGHPASVSPTNTVQGCHNYAVNVGDGKGTRYADAGLDQLPWGYPSTPGLAGVGYPGSPNFPHSGCAAVNTAGTGGGTGAANDGCGANANGAGLALVFDTQNTGRNSLTVSKQVAVPDLNALLANGVYFYNGADDNLDAGEHDGVNGCATSPPDTPNVPCTNDGSSGAVNGPSDGGAITLFADPSRAGAMPGLTDPLPAAGGSEGACADGFCQEVTTHQQTLYNGGGGANGKTQNRQVANYDGKTWDPYGCSSGSQSSEGQTACGGHTMDWWRQQEAQNVNAEPGVQVYEDPDPQASPIDPLFEGGVTPSPVLYPLPAVYAGTCGVVAGGGPVATAPAGAPVTDKSGQVVVATGCPTK